MVAQPRSARLEFHRAGRRVDRRYAKSFSHSTYTIAHGEARVMDLKTRFLGGLRKIPIVIQCTRFLDEDGFKKKSMSNGHMLHLQLQKTITTVFFGPRSVGITFFGS